MNQQAWKLEHPITKLDYAAAIEYVEEWLTQNHLSKEQRKRGFAWHVYDYLDRDPAKLIERPWLGVRVSEVDISYSNGGSSYMQTDMPWGVAFCGQVERCIIALIECWNEDATADGPNYGDTEDEFWRLGHLVEESKKEA